MGSQRALAGLDSEVEVDQRVGYPGGREAVLTHARMREPMPVSLMYGYAREHLMEIVL